MWLTVGALPPLKAAFFFSSVEYWIANNNWKRAVCQNFYKVFKTGLGKCILREKPFCVAAPKSGGKPAAAEKKNEAKCERFFQFVVKILELLEFFGTNLKKGDLTVHI